jgi:hypothetical protein
MEPLKTDSRLAQEGFNMNFAQAMENAVNHEIQGELKPVELKIIDLDTQRRIDTGIASETAENQVDAYSDPSLSYRTDKICQSNQRLGQEVEDIRMVSKIQDGDLQRLAEILVTCATAVMRELADPVSTSEVSIQKNLQNTVCYAHTIAALRGSPIDTVLLEILGRSVNKRTWL